MALGIPIPASTHMGRVIVPGATDYHSHGPIPAGTVIDTITWNMSFDALPALIELSPVITFSDSADQSAHASGMALVSSAFNTVNGKAAVFFQPQALSQSPLQGAITTDWPIETASAYVLIALENNAIATGDWLVFTNVTFKKLPGFNP